MSGYQSTHDQVCPVVNAVTLAHIKGREEPVLLLIHYATLVNDANESESLLQPFQAMRHGVMFDMTPTIHHGRGVMDVDNEELPFHYDGEKLYYSISKPTQEDLDTYDCYELTSALETDFINHIKPKRGKKATMHEGIPMEEWRRQLALAPEDVIQKTLENTTQCYMTVDCENRTNMKEHYKSHFRGLKLPRLNEGVATDTFSPSVRTARGHKCSQMFTGMFSNRWHVYPLKKESHNGIALQDFSRNEGLPLFIKSDNAQSQTGDTWTTHCREHCIQTKTTEPGHPWQNPCEKEIGTLNAMVVANMRQHGIPLNKHDWVLKWCCAVHNVLSSRRLKWQNPDAIATGYTTDISKFRFHAWEPIWHYVRNVKAPKNNVQKGRWLGFAETAGDAMTYYSTSRRNQTLGRRRNRKF